MILSKQAVGKLKEEVRTYKKLFDQSMESCDEAVLELGISFQDERYVDFKRSYGNIEGNLKELTRNLEKAAQRLQEIENLIKNV